MSEPEVSASPPSPTARSRPRERSPRGTCVIGAGSFGTALAVLLARGGQRTTLQTRTAEQAALLLQERENRRYRPGVELPGQLAIEPSAKGLARADLVFLAVPSRALPPVIDALAKGGLEAHAAVVSVTKGLVPPEGTLPTLALRRA